MRQSARRTLAKCDFFRGLLESFRVLGLLHEGGVPAGIPGYRADTVFPTVVVTNADGVVVFCDQTDNYRVRPTPDTVLEALAEARAWEP